MVSENEDSNPWLSIPAADYERHMGGSSVRQLQFLNGVLREILDDFRPRTMAVIGCSTGNGFEHIDPRITQHVIGIDINPEYLGVLWERFGHKIPGLKLLCADVTKCDLQPRSLDLVHCALVLEYVEPRLIVEKAAEWVRSRGVLTVLLQLPSAGHDNVTDTEFESVRRLESIMRLVDPKELGRIAEQAGFSETSSRVDTLASGKQFYVGVYRREEPGCKGGSHSGP
jgi:SAM-dependent methyltransferase